MRGKGATEDRALEDRTRGHNRCSACPAIGEGGGAPRSSLRSPITSRARFDGIRRKCFILPMVHRYHRGSGVWVALSKHHRLMHEAFEEEGA